MEHDNAVKLSSGKGTLATLEHDNVPTNKNDNAIELSSRKAAGYTEQEHVHETQ